MDHYLSSTPDNLHWGHWNERLRAAIEISSGDRITIETLPAERDELPAIVPGFRVALDQYGVPSVHDSSPRLLTGPIHVKGAQPGDVLEVRVIDIRLRADWGWNMQVPARGRRPEDTLDFCRRHVSLDRARNVARLPWGRELRLSPCFGDFGVAPPANWDRRPRGGFSGHIDNEDLGVGCTVYFPVFVQGALFSAGHGRALLHDERRPGAIETALAGTFEFHVHRDLHLSTPRLETTRVLGPYSSSKTNKRRERERQRTN
jgi:acetamidase/formamidase